MFYDQEAEVYIEEMQSDGMGGWEDNVIKVIDELVVRRAPVNAETLLKQYGIITTTAIKLYTEDEVPEGDVFIRFEGREYRIIERIIYDVETVLLIELI